MIGVIGAVGMIGAIGKVCRWCGTNIYGDCTQAGNYGVEDYKLKKPKV